MEIKKYQLPKEFATKWVEALRSGQYEQDCDHAQFRFEGAYCAVGIAGIANNLEFKGNNKIVVSNGEDIINFLGIPLFREVYDLNDTVHKSFEQIADWIETNVEFI